MGPRRSSRNPLSSQVISNAEKNSGNSPEPKAVVIPYQVRSYQTEARLREAQERGAGRNPLSSQVISNRVRT